MSGATRATLIRRLSYGGRKGRRARLRLRSMCEVHTYSHVSIFLNGVELQLEGAIVDLSWEPVDSPKLDSGPIEFRWEIEPIFLAAPPLILGRDLFGDT